MRAFSRFVGSFVVLLGIAYLVMVVLLPPAPSVAENLETGRSAATQLSEQAGALIGHKVPARR